ncbi:MAG: chromosomal replication initiator DnaA [Caulobacteraceae bacterium]|nr:chromosomal replication initiator DnaA [Caulobacter sp.]
MSIPLVPLPPSDPPADSPRAALVIQLVALATGVSPVEIGAPRRGDAGVVRARHLAMYLAHTAFGWPLKRVAAAFGRDRSTVSYACATVEDGRDDPRLDRSVTALETMLQAAPEGWLS